MKCPLERAVPEELLRRAPQYEIEVSPTFRFLDLGLASIPAGLESLKLTVPHHGIDGRWDDG